MGARINAVCIAIGLCPRRYRRWKQNILDGRIGGYRAQGQKMTEVEKDEIVELVERQDMKHLPIRVVHAKHLDEGLCLGSPATFFRVLKERNRPDRIQAPKCHARSRPILKAEAINHLWCWDITWLCTQVNGKYFYFYSVLDVFSRKIVAFDVRAKEDGYFARQMFAKAFEDEAVPLPGLVLHQDNGQPMKHASMRLLMERLGVVQSFSRPHTSNDNAFAESLFATFKSRLGYPEYFRSLEDAFAFCQRFVTWYNTEHCHGALDYLTPNQMHEGKGLAIQTHRNHVLAQNRLTHPARYGKRIRIFRVPTKVELKHRTLLQNQAMS